MIVQASEVSVGADAAAPQAAELAHKLRVSCTPRVGNNLVALHACGLGGKISA